MLPASIKTVRVTFGPYLDHAGDPLRGVVTFTPSASPIVHYATATPLIKAPLAVELVDGSGSIVLPATDQSGLNTKNWTYQVELKLLDGTSPTPINIAVPQTATTVDLDLMTPVEGSSGIAIPSELLSSEINERIRIAVETATAGLYPDGGFDVVVILGQSNAQGAAVDFTRGLAPDVDPLRAYQFGGTAKDNPRVGAGEITTATDPLIHRWTQTKTDGTLQLTKGLGMPFARKYAPTLAGGRRLLFVPAAYSGTGFNKTNHGTESSTHWRPGDNTGVNLYESAIAQTKAALLAAGANVRLVAAIWMQGETDEVTPAATYQTYLLSLIDGFRSRLNAPQLPFLIGGMVPEGLVGNSGRAAIDGVHRAIPSLRPYTSFSAGPTGKFIDSGLHYSAAGQEDLGASIYAGLATAQANIPNPPAQVTGLAAGTPGSKSVSLTWAAADRASSYLVEYKRNVDSTWTTGADTTATAASVSGLSAQVAYNFRVKAVNGGGTGTASSTVSVTTLAAGFVLSDLGVQATRAYGVRKLHAGYTGPLMRVLRVNDAAELDVAATSSGVLDTAAVLSWAGSNTVLVKTFYDLTGNGLHLTQGTQNNMARIALNGVIDAIGGKPAPVANANTYYTGTFTGPSLYSRGASTSCAVSYGTATANGRLMSETSSTAASQQYVPIMANITTAALLSQRITADDASSIAPDSATVAAFSNALVQITSTDTGSSFVKRVNGADAGTVTYTRGGTLTLNVFTWGGLFRNGAFGAPIATRPIELVTFPAALSDTDRNTVEASQKTYFGTP
ncbi:putative 9-O-acetyl-N-acetylneuraminic acid deacetylase precursor [Clavibacter michiganensis subsp. michiganensis]|uniref:sialate O-acetylesterase n=1 Tax=Clavibacter michiganensis TaxID=28447 RepID=UPI0013031803|nr:sialate O-acetylesterase [Clavibacter michiganensis]KAF0258776.1 putative 9-O-acetyl-N-acetylneuraminic acid deacetylase precursor [Clavibacter michiganensis subsp. michiganensis]